MIILTIPIMVNLFTKFMVINFPIFFPLLKIFVILKVVNVNFMNLKIYLVVLIFIDPYFLVEEIFILSYYNQFTFLDSSLKMTLFILSIILL